MSPVASGFSRKDAPGSSPFRLKAEATAVGPQICNRCNPNRICGQQTDPGQVPVTFAAVHVRAHRHIRCRFHDPHAEVLMGRGLWVGVTLLAVPIFPATAAAESGSLTIAWDPNAEADVAGYRVHIGTQPGTYSVVTDAGNRTALTIAGSRRGTAVLLHGDRGTARPACPVSCRARFRRSCRRSCRPTASSRPTVSRKRAAARS